MHLSNFTALVLLVQWFGLSIALNHHAPLTHHNIRRQSSSSSRYTGKRVPSYNISIPVDHFNKADTRMFNNRYWVNDTYWQPGGPVFFLDGGESGITEQWATQNLAEVNRTSAVMKLAAKYKGIAVFFEHRYYGLSLPIPINKTTHEPVGGIAGYKYLNVEQAMEDVVYFANNWKPVGCSGDECTAVKPSKAPWVWLGGSYPGVRGALMRIRNPEIFHASWASSAPVQAVIDGSIYYNPIEASLPSNCSADIKAAIKYADAIMDGKYGPTALQQLQALVEVASTTVSNVSRSYTLSNSSISYWKPFTIGRLMASVLTADFQADGPTYATNKFCNYMQSFNPNAAGSITKDPYISILSNPGDGVITTTGLAAKYNSTVALQAYFYGWRKWYENWYRVLSTSNTGYVDSPPDYNADDRSWLYQVMTEFGWFQASNPANITIVSKFFNYTSQRNSLAQYFNSPGAASQFPAQPNITALNKYGGWNMNPSNVMFTDGEFDPWRAGSVMSNEPWIDAPLRQVVTTVPACGKSPSGNNVFGLVFPGEVHVPDLGEHSTVPYDSRSPVYQATTLFMKALDVWLPCFKSS